MRYTLQILRRKNAAEKPSWHDYTLETELESATVATALSLLNQTLDDKIMWDCSCLQKKCGACAMVINGKPRLACNVRLNESADKEGRIKVEPLKKFPVIADLVVDRTVLYENLEAINAWLSKGTMADEKKNDLLYEASRCLQCGCCLEICPNFYAGGHFFGMASMVPVARLLEELPREEKKELRKKYQKHIYNGCGKSLACRNICPAEIDIEKLLVNSNAVLIWKYLLKDKGV